MTNPYDALNEDIQKVQQISIVPTILDVVCRTTGMGFAAVARVTQDKWIACSVKDDIEFGLKTGGELKIETTICNEIRDSRRAVVIDHVAKDVEYRHHHTPAMYGFQSYISVPVFLRSGAFFGTLCAIDPSPNELNNPKVIGMFNLFAELIGFHLHSLDIIEQSGAVIKELNRQLVNSMEENRQYRHVSNHNIQEPLRKIRIFSDVLVNASDKIEPEKTKDLAMKINASAQKVSMMIKDISDLSELYTQGVSLQGVNLYTVVSHVCLHLQEQLDHRKGVVNLSPLPVIPAIPLQIEQLFFHLISNAIKFARPDLPLVLDIYTATPLPEEMQLLPLAPDGTTYVTIRLRDNGIGIEHSQLEKIFEVFSKVSYDPSAGGFGIGLAYCRKILHNHHGIITVASVPGAGTTFSLVFPVNA